MPGCAVQARCPNPSKYLDQAAEKHLYRTTGRDESVISNTKYVDPRLYQHGALREMDLNDQEKKEPGMPIFRRRFPEKPLFNPHVPGQPARGLPNPVRACELRGISRDWINYDSDVKRAGTMTARTQSWTRSRPVTTYDVSKGFAKTPCFDPSPYNETGFPFNPRPVSLSCANKNNYTNHRVFKQPFNRPNECQQAVGMGSHEEEPSAVKSQHGFGDTRSSIPFVNFLPVKPTPRGVQKEKANFASAMLQPPRFVQTARIMAPRRRAELIAKYDEDGDGDMDSEELAAAPTHVREFMAYNKIGPANPATKFLPKGALTFASTGPLLTPRRSHKLAQDRHLYSKDDLEKLRKGIKLTLQSTEDGVENDLEKTAEVMDLAKTSELMEISETADSEEPHASQSQTIEREGTPMELSEISSHK